MGVWTREKICSLVIPGDAIATPCAVHNTPIDLGDEQSTQGTIRPNHRPSDRSAQVSAHGTLTLARTTV
ncbi:MAG TPA: hypothetical protein VLX92_04675 [Kofleriaceae bacterium]|nr:hypothetical protein [Kofleriaceae bacterium]